MLGEVPSFVVNGDGKSPHPFRLSESTLSTIDQVMAGFKIVGGDFIGADSRVARYEFMTEGEGKWRVEVEGGVYRYLADSIRPHDSDRFIEQLSSLQQLTFLLRTDEQHHARDMCVWYLLIGRASFCQYFVQDKITMEINPVRIVKSI